MRILLALAPRDCPPRLADHLLAAGFEIEPVATGAAVARRCAATGIAGLLLSRRLADGDTLALVRRLRIEQAGAALLILDRGAPADMRFAGLEAGADDYLTQACPAEDVVARLRAFCAPAVDAPLRCGPLEFDLAQQSAAMAGTPLDLSFRETQILGLLARRAGMVVSRALLEEQIFAVDAGLGSNAVAVNIHRLRQKLRRAGDAVHIATVKGLGYRLQARGAAQPISR